jgi:hypothetical protein
MRAPVLKWSGIAGTAIVVAAVALSVTWKSGEDEGESSHERTIAYARARLGGAGVVALPHQQSGQIVDVLNDGSNLRFKNLGGPIGSYWDYAGSSNPAWNSGCTVPPYLNCDGSTFSAATYPSLAVILGSTTLPDEKMTDLAKGMYDSRDFSPMPILADALQDADCDSEDILNHCRDPNQVHVRGCWVVDFVLGKQ